MKCKYYYKGESLYNYCKKNNVEYSNVIATMRKLRSLKEFNEYSDDQIVSVAVESTGNFFDKRYHGYNLLQYCKKYDLNYSQIFGRITTLKKDESNKNKSNEELLDLAINGDFSIYTYQYKYNNQQLQEYCKDNDIRFESVVKRIKKNTRKISRTG